MNLAFRYKTLLILLLLLESTTNSFGQSLVKSYTTSDGLSNDMVYASFVDSDHMLWVSTGSGLNLFNGINFYKVNVVTNEFGKEANNLIFMGICEDKQRQVYFATYGNGVFIYNKKKGRFKHLTVEKDTALCSNTVSNVAEYEGNIYIITDKGISVYYPTTQKLKRISNASLPFVEACITKDDICFLGILNNLYFYKKNKYIELKDKNQTSTYPLNDCDTAFNEILCSSSSGVFITKNNALIKCKVILSNKEDISEQFFLGTTSTAFGKYILSTTKGLLKIDSLSGTNILYAHAILSLNAEPNTFYTNLTYDAINKTFILSTSLGIQVISLESKPFTQVKLPDKYRSNVISVNKLDSHLLIGTQSHLLTYQTDTRQFQKIESEIFPSMVSQITPYKNRFILNTQRGLFDFNGTRISKNIPASLKDIQSLHNNFMLYVGKHHIAFSKINDTIIYIWNTVNDKIIKVSHSNFNDGIYALPINDTEFVFVNKQICKIHLNSGKAAQLHGFPNSLSTSASVHGHTLWVSCFGNGLYAYDLNTNKICDSITELNGLTSNGVYSLYKSGKYLYAIHTLGIDRIDLENKSKYFFSAADGFHHTNFALGKSATTENLPVLIQSDGISMGNNLDHYNKLPKASVEVIGIAYHKNGKYQNVPLENELTLEHNQNNLLLTLVSTNYEYTERNQIYYRLNGGEWLPNGISKELRFNELPHGKYILELKHKDHFYPGGKIKKLQFEILPAWYQTWWFRISLSLVSIAIISSLIMYYYKTQLKQKQAEIEKLLAINKERERISADLHDDLGSSVSAIALVSNLALHKIDDPKVKAELQNVYEQSITLNEKVREIVWTNKADNDTLEILLIYIRQYISRQLDALDINARISLPDPIPAKEVSAQKRKDIYLTVKETINNIAKHANASEVIVKMEYNAPLLQISIEDNGKGLPNSLEYGNGIKQMKQRIEKHNGYYTLDNKDLGGTLTIVKINI